MESATKDFSEILEKIILIKNKIEKEINDINIQYEKAINDLTKSFLKKHENLLKEENDIKEKLQIEVTKIKEILENFLSQANNQIKINEKIQEGIKKIKKEEKNIIQSLTYISKMNKNKKGMKALSNQLMKSLKFNYEENNIKYNDFYFNGIPIPKNIEIKDIKYTSANIYWEIDNFNYLDNNKIKYRIEIRKENEEFNKLYEGNNKNYLINNLLENANYEFRICSVIDDSYGIWTEIQKIPKVDSIILKESKRENEFISKMLEWSGYKGMELIYRGSRDGTTATAFHIKCDNMGPTIILFRNEKGNIFGGYCPISWHCKGRWEVVTEAFIFTLTNIYNIEPTKFNRGNTAYDGICFNKSGPWFGSGPNIGFSSDYSKSNDSSSNFGENNSYQDCLGKGRSIFTGDFNNNNKIYKINEIEGFKLYK